MPETTDCESLKRILTNARVPYAVSPAKTFPGYTILETPHTTYIFDVKGKCCEITQKES